MQLTTKQKMGKLISIYRRDRQLSQNELAQQLNYSQSVISRMELGYEEISGETYVDVLETFELTIDPSDETKESIESIIKEAYHQIMFLDLEPFLVGLNQFNQCLPNVLYQFDYSILKAYELYYIGDEKKSWQLTRSIIKFETLLHPLCRELYYYLLASFYLRRKHHITHLKQFFMNRFSSDKAIDQYILGVYYYYTHQYTKALPVLYQATESFLKEGNQKRYSRAEIYLIKILMIEHDYFSIKMRLEEFLNKQPELINRDLSSLQFQLAYSYYHLKETEKAYQLFQSIQYPHFKYAPILPYMIYKCERRLNIKSNSLDKPLSDTHILFYLYDHYQMDAKPTAYYEAIETHLLPQLQRQIELKEFQIHLFELLDYYFHQQRYNDYKQLIERINHIYKVV